jgi:DNA polymerase-1
VCGIQSLIAAFKRGEDPYEATASWVLGIPLEKVTPSQRDDFKRNVLARIYLESMFSLAKRNKLEEGRVREVDEKLSLAMPELDAAVQAVFEKVDRGEVFETAYGRRRTFKPEEKRSAWNNPIQSECADIAAQKLMELCDACFPELRRSEELMEPAVPFLLIYDAIMAIMPKDEFLFDRIHRMGEIMHDMETLPMRLNVPLATDAAYGSTWANMRELKEEFAPSRHAGWDDAGNDVMWAGYCVYSVNEGSKKAPKWVQVGKVDADG